MKKPMQVFLQLSTLIILTLTMSKMNASSLPDSLTCMKIMGVIESDLKENPCVVELHLNGQLLDSVQLPAPRFKFQFLLERNKTYTLRIKQSGSIDKLISIVTDLPDYQEGIFRFKFTTRLISNQESLRLNKDALDFPVAIIYFEEKEKCFDYCRKYTSETKRNWYKTTPENNKSLSLNHKPSQSP